jgi:hypothetical protein
MDKFVHYLANLRVILALLSNPCQDSGERFSVCYARAQAALLCGVKH